MIYNIPKHKFRNGYFSAIYFYKKKIILEKSKNYDKVLMQIFHRKNNTITSGVDEIKKILELCCGYYKDTNKASDLFTKYLEVEQSIKSLEINSNICDYKNLKNLYHTKLELEERMDMLWCSKFNEIELLSYKDNSLTKALLPVMNIKGSAQYFTYLESIILGILNRSSTIATNVYNIKKIIKDKTLIFFGDRQDRWENQIVDGYTSLRNNIDYICTNAMGELTNTKSFGTISHSLITINYGNITNASLIMNKYFPQDNIIALVDYHNDCINSTLETIKKLKDKNKKLWGVRVDTSYELIDKSLQNHINKEGISGVSKELILKLKDTLIKTGNDDIKIIVSGGFDIKKIKEFELNKIPVDAYGIGSSIIQKNHINYTADIVKVNDKFISKTGRKFIYNKYLNKNE